MRRYGRSRALAALALVLLASAVSTAAPGAAGAQTRMLVVGDVGSGGEAERALGAAVRAFERTNPADLLVTLGDNDYTDDPAAFRRSWRGSFGWLAEAGIGVAGALGDHDTQGEDDGRWELSTLGMPGPYYVRRLGDVELFVLDASSRRRVDDTQTIWLERALEASRARWKIAVVHRPPYTCGRYRGSPEVLARWVPLFERYGVKLVLSGDDHNYQRFEPRQGVTYVVHAAANANTYPLETCPETYPRRLAASTERGFLYLVASSERLEGTAVSIEGERLDRFSIVAGPAYTEGGDLGFEDGSFEGARRSPSGSKPESKLWWNDGLWWGSLFDTKSGDFHIFKLDLAGQKWVDTGVPLDERVRSRADALWDGQQLYVASHVGSDTPTPGFPSRLYRFSYDPATRTYSLDKGFPVAINDTSSETLVIDKDSTGTLWATWVQDGQVYVNRTTADDRTWGRPFVLPVDGADAGPDNISALVAFGGDRIGVLWSNQRTQRFYFAVHRDGRYDKAWDESEEIEEVPSADDHINLKADARGRVFAAVKTSVKAGSDPLVSLLVRDPEAGTWTAQTFGTFADGHSRPILLVDAEHDVLHVFATGPLAPERGGTIYVKVAPLDDLRFELGPGTPVLRDVEDPDVSDATSTKQPVSSKTGLVVLATNNLTRAYWHYYSSLRTHPIPLEGSEEEEEEEEATPSVTAATPVEPPTGASAGLRELLHDARPALIVALGLPVWLIAFAAVRLRRELAFLGVYVLLALAVAAAITLAVAALVL